MFKFRDILQLYQLEVESDNLFAMLQDYVLDNRVNRTILNNQILLRLGVLYPLYNESSVMKFAIDNWFAEHNPIIKKLLDLTDSYNLKDPFVNTDWQEMYGGQRSDVNRENETEGITNTIDRNTQENSTTENLVSAYDASDYQPQNKTEMNRTSELDETDAQDRSTENLFNGNRTESHNLRHIGKEGIENYSKMLEDARNAAQFNIYEWILERLEKAICLGVY